MQLDPTLVHGGVAKRILKVLGSRPGQWDVKELYQRVYRTSGGTPAGRGAFLSTLSALGDAGKIGMVVREDDGALWIWLTPDGPEGVAAFLMNER